MTLLNIMYIINNNNETHQNLCYDYHRFLKHKYNHKCQLVEGGGLWGTLELGLTQISGKSPNSKLYAWCSFLENIMGGEGSIQQQMWTICDVYFLQ